MMMNLIRLFVCLYFASAVAETTVRQDLGAGELLEITSADAVPAVLLQASPRIRSYPENLLTMGLHFRGGKEITAPMDIRMVNLNTSHVIGAHGEGTVVRYTGRWQADGGNAFPHLALTGGARFVFTERSSMNLVLEGSFFTRQLWVWGDGTGVLELEEGFVADRTRSEPLPDALGTIRLGGATLITHHTRNLPVNTRPDGRGGHYPNGHIVFERVPGNRWIVDSTNQHYGAQVDFATDAVVETRAALTHIGHLRVVLPVGPGGHFISSGAFRTTSPDVTITKTGPAMLALEGEQSYLPGSRLVVEEGLLRMATDPGLGRDPAARGTAGAYLHLEVKNAARAHFIGSLHRLQSLSVGDEARIWVDETTVLETTEGLNVGPNATLNLAGALRGPVRVQGTLALSGTPRFQSLVLDGSLTASFGSTAPEGAVLLVEEALELKGDLNVRFGDRQGRVPEQVLLVEAPEAALSTRGPAFTGTRRCVENKFQFDFVREGGQLWMRNIRAVSE